MVNGGIKEKAMKNDPSKLTFAHAQYFQPWTVPYAAGIDVASQKLVPHILGSHVVLHATKSIGKIAGVFEQLDHSRSTGVASTSEQISEEQRQTLKNMAADLITAGLRLANLYKFDAATELIARVQEKNNATYPDWY